MKQSLHDLYHYMGQDQHFKIAVIITLIYTMLCVIAGMLLCYIIYLLVDKLFRHDKFSGPLGRLLHFIDRIRRRTVRLLDRSRKITA